MTNEGEFRNEYDLAGNLVAESDPLGRVTSRSYNARGQETSVTLDPDGAGPLTASVFTKAFNARGDLISQTDAMGNSTSWTYNAQGQPLTQSDPDPDGTGPLPAAVTTFTYDQAGRRSSVTDATGNTTHYLYDHAGRLVQEIDPRGNSTHYQYDAAGQVTCLVDRNSRKREFSYNDLGLVTEEIWIDGFGNPVKTIEHGYDNAGREISISDGITGYNYQYDLADRVTYTDNGGSVDMPQVQLQSYYDFEGNRTWLGDNRGGGISYAWNNQRLQSMVLFTGDYKSAQVGFSYDPVGRLNSISRMVNWDLSTPMNTNFTLDLLDRVTSITHSKVMGEDASTLSQFSYTYDANGRISSYTGSESSLSYALDTNGQLLSVTGSHSEAYTFDANGNRTSNSTAAGNLLFNDGYYNYTYDLEGNQTTKTRISDGQLTEYFWDHRNQLTKALVNDANGILLKELRFTYDVGGRRVGVWVDADGAGPEEPDQVWTVYDGVNPYMDFDGEGLLKTRYLYGPGIDELFARIGTGEDPEWYLADRLGSVRQIVDGAGTILDDIVYDSFGNVLSESNPAEGDRFKFTGREFSPELGIYYYRARWYDPGSGRFISQDPIGFRAGDVNLYRYVGNAPGDATDPEGLQKVLGGFSQERIKNRNQLLEELSKGDQASLDGFMQGKPFKPERHGQLGQMFPFPQEGENKGQGDSWIWDYLHGALDAAGTVEPTPICDSVNALLYLLRGKWSDAGLTSLGVIPYFGDWAKVGKYGNKIINAQDGTKIIGFTSHGIDRVVGDIAKRTGTNPGAILDALKNPISIKSGVDLQGRPFKIFTGQNPRIIVNPDTGKIVSVNPLSKSGTN